AVKEEVFDLSAVAGKLVSWLAKKHPEAVRERYRLIDLPGEPAELLEAIGRKRGFIVSGGSVDTLKAAQNVLKEFREGKLGQFTLDEPTSP
ncbi:MAG: ribosome biogenesis GTPase YlqF, partial [Bacillota bacterium]